MRISDTKTQNTNWSLLKWEINHVIPVPLTYLDLIKEMIESSEQDRQESLKQIERLRKECNDLRKLRNNINDNIDDEDAQRLKEHLKTAYSEITMLKKAISQFSYQNVDQCANLGKEVISLQIQLDKQKTQNSKFERGRSFSRTVGKHYFSDIVRKSYIRDWFHRW
jgi:hypothetical protein